MGDYEISFEQGMAGIDRDEWDGLAHSCGNPLLSWGFLALLEESGSICPETGWQPAHALVRRRGGGGGPARLVAAAPFYARGDSWGEFIYDFGFARYAESIGAAWYPKLVGVVPATPAPAWRVLTAPGEDAEALEALVISAAEEAARQSGLAGLHIEWPASDVAQRLSSQAAAFARWDHQVFLWRDRGYGDFDGLLDAFSKNMRRNVKRDRAMVADAGFSARIVGAAEAAAQPGLLEAVADMYESHNAKFGPWAARFLERGFFLRLPEYMPEGWAVGLAWRDGPGGAGGAGGAQAQPGLPAALPDAADIIAMSFFFEGRERLFGRYYGEREEVPGLHFELCYYLPLEYALSRGLASFDPGLGSPHKVRRGFRPVLAPSFHRVFDKRLASAAARAFRDANLGEAEGIKALEEESPYKDGR